MQMKRAAFFKAEVINDLLLSRFPDQFPGFDLEKDDYEVKWFVADGVWTLILIKEYNTSRQVKVSRRTRRREKNVEEVSAVPV